MRKFEYEKPELVGYQSFLSHVVGETEECDFGATAVEPDTGGHQAPCVGMGGME